MSTFAVIAALAIAQAKAAPVPERAPMPKVEAAPSGQAVVIIRLPADAELYINRCYIRSESDRRTFVTPLLWPGAVYVYELRVNVVRDSRTYTEYRFVTFRAGETVEVTFTAFPGLPMTGIRRY